MTQRSSVIIITKLQSIVVRMSTYTYYKILIIYFIQTSTGSNSSMMYGALRLTGGNSSMGRLEINIDGVWGSVCLRSFSMRDGHVACRQLGYKGVFSILNVNASWYAYVCTCIFTGSVFYFIVQDK